MNAAPLPQTSDAATFAEFRDRHRGETVIVCGCGESLKTLENADTCVTIGINDVGRLFDPDYLVVVNPPSQFKDDRWPFVERSRARYVFSQLDLRLRQAPLVKFRLGRFGGAGFEEPDVLHFTQNSPYVGVALAMFMGASRIGIVGVDFTDHHFFGRTGVHPLTHRLVQIDGEYARLRDVCSAQGIELVNLSATSRLTALPRVAIRTFLEERTRPKRRVFFVNYQFLACGDVFTQGLRHAAEELGIDFADADWSDPDLPTKVERFTPDLLFVVHGRKFVRKWGTRFSEYRTALWLLDEPYEVDDSSVYSQQFKYTFVNDPSTLGRHRNATYLPVCYDPPLHVAGDEPRSHAVGFIGGGNPTRERFLLALAERGVLSYVVGGPWTDPRINRLCRARNIAPSETSAIYRSTRIVLNVFRDRHHFNQHGVAPVSLNPRVYEALACGALVVSEWRPELERLVPQMPTFRSEEELVAIVDALLADPARTEELRAACAAQMAPHTYADRLRTVMDITLGSTAPDDSRASARELLPARELPPVRELPSPLSAEWMVSGRLQWAFESDNLMLTALGDGSPGSESGIVTRDAYETVDLSFDVWIPSDGCFIAKVHQASALEQQTNSYHLFCNRRATYLARHDHIFRNVEVPRNQWIRLRLVRGNDMLSIFQDDRLLHRVHDVMLARGYAALTVKAGSVRVRDVRLSRSADSAMADPVSFQHLHGVARIPAPRVSIVTTVYDRTDCLRRCLQSVKRLQYRDLEHIIVSDAPPPGVVGEIARIVAQEDDGRQRYFNLDQRANNWGNTPAAVGLRRAAGEFVCFLSDDNGYKPEHVGMLVQALDQDPGLGFAYSSCWYGGLVVLAHPRPAPGRIDLGQPMFRRELFERHLGNDLPFNVIAWDWALVDTLMKRGARWKHVDVTSFIFRLAQYPDLMDGMTT